MRLTAEQIEKIRAEWVGDLYPTTSEVNALCDMALRSVEVREDAVPSKIYRCNKHGGYGFVSDCEICNPPKAAPAGLKAAPDEAREPPQVFYWQRSGMTTTDTLGYRYVRKVDHDALLAANARLRTERAALLNIKSTDGLSSGEWMLRTALAEKRAESTERKLAERDAHADAAGYARGLQVSRDAVNALIVPGELPGNGCDLHAQRNGYIIAANTLFALKPAQDKGAAHE